MDCRGAIVIGLVFSGALAHAGGACQAQRFTIVVCHHNNKGQYPPRYSPCWDQWGWDVVGHGFLFKDTYYTADCPALDLTDGSRRTVITTHPNQWPLAVQACLGPVGPPQFGSKTKFRDDTIKLPGWTGEKFGETFGEPASFEVVGGGAPFVVIAGGAGGPVSSGTESANAHAATSEKKSVDPSSLAKTAPAAQSTPSPAPNAPVFSSAAAAQSSAPANRAPASAEVQTTGPAPADVSFATGDAIGNAGADVLPSILPPVAPAGGFDGDVRGRER